MVRGRGEGARAWGALGWVGWGHGPCGTQSPSQLLHPHQHDNPNAPGPHRSGRRWMPPSLGDTNAILCCRVLPGPGRANGEQ